MFTFKRAHTAVLLLLLLLALSACSSAPKTPANPPAGAGQTPVKSGEGSEAAASPTGAAASATVSTPSDTPPPPTATSSPTFTPTPLPTIGAGSIMLSRSDQRPMVFIPGGQFLMGASPNDPAADDDEKPQHTVTLDAFWIDQYEVTNEAYAACVQAGACNAPADKDYNGFPYAFAAQIRDAPVVNVTWKDANAYCAWAGKRLPTEAEWEKAAHGEEGRLYPWGDSPEAHGKAWFCEGCIYDWEHPDLRDDFSRPGPVGSFPEGVSPYGLFDMAGNVWEWVFDRYGADTYQPGRVNPTGPETGGYRVIRGGGWTTSDVRQLRTTYRDARGPLTAWIDVGFRCAMEDDRSKLIFPGQPTETPTPTPSATPTRTPGPTSTPTLTPTPFTPTPLPEELPNYKLVYADADGVVYTVNADGSGATALTDGTRFFHSPAWSPAGGTIAMIGPAGYGPGVYLISPTGNNLRPIFIGNTGDGATSDSNLKVLSYKELGNLRWSADGKRLLFNSIADISLTTLSINLHTISASGGGFASLVWGVQASWSPTGNQMAIALAQDSSIDSMELVKSHVSLSDSPVVLSSGGLSAYPAWSPDERFIAYLRKSSNGFDLHIMHPDGSGSRTLGSTDQAAYPAWSPDSREIALAGGGAVKIIRVEGGDERVLDVGVGEIVYLEWSPDGTRLALVNASGQLYVVRADGAGLTQAATGLNEKYTTHWVTGHDWQPAPIWSPRPQNP